MDTKRPVFKQGFFFFNGKLGNRDLTKWSNFNNYWSHYSQYTYILKYDTEINPLYSETNALFTWTLPITTKMNISCN